MLATVITMALMIGGAGAISFDRALSAAMTQLYGKIVVGFRCRMTLYCDRSIVDGATNAGLLQSLQQIVEIPILLAP